MVVALSGPIRPCGIWHAVCSRAKKCTRCRSGSKKRAWTERCRILRDRYGPKVLEQAAGREIFPLSRMKEILPTTFLRRRQSVRSKNITPPNTNAALFSAAPDQEVRSATQPGDGQELQEAKCRRPQVMIYIRSHAEGSTLLGYLARSFRHSARRVCLGRKGVLCDSPPRTTNSPTLPAAREGLPEETSERRLAYELVVVGNLDGAGRERDIDAAFIRAACEISFTILISPASLQGFRRSFCRL